MPCHHNAGQNYKTNIANRLFENVAKLQYVGKRITNQNVINEEINTRFSSSNDCHYSVQNN
jgi:hypothetical protein